MKDEASYQCNYCHRRFQREKAFIRHKCKLMQRDEELRTPIGQAAWHFYQDWMKLQRKRVADDRAFLKSNYYLSFNRFAAFVKKLNLPTPDVFIKMMVEHDYPPTLWTRDEVYVKYLEHLDRNVSPGKLAGITVDTLFDQAEMLGCDVDQVFNHINPNNVIQLVRERKLSPWLLLRSPKFFIFLQKINQENKEQFIVLEAVIRPKYWKSRFDEKPDTVKTMEAIVTDLNL